MRPNSPRAILFDWDSTLVDNWDVITRAMNAALSRFAKPEWTRAAVIESATLSARDRFPELFGDDAPAAQQVFYDAFQAYHLEELKPLPGAIALLDFLTDLKLPLAVVSNKGTQFLHREINGLGWDRYFQTIIGAGDAERDKPDPAPVHLALRRLSIDRPQSVYFLGDTEADIGAGKAAGCVTMLLRQDENRFAAAKQMGPDHLFDDLDAVLTFLKREQRSISEVTA